MKKLLFVFMLSVLTLGWVWAQGLETFENHSLSGTSYVNGNFVGNDGITWNYVHVTGEQGYPINDKGIILRRSGDNSKIYSSTISGGIGSFSIQMRKAFTSAGDRQIALYVNDTWIADSQTFNPSGADATIHTFAVNDINIAGDIVIEVRHIQGGSNNRQLTIDNLSWTGFSGGAATPPVIYNISTIPATDITPTTTVHVSATITDADGDVELAELSWGLSSGDLPHNIDMVKGANDVWTTETPIPAQPDGTTVYYTIYALDDEANDTTSPEMNYISLTPQPQLNLSPITLTGFSYILDRGPSAAKTFVLSGIALTENVLLFAPDNYEISLNPTTEYTGVGLELDIESDGALAGTTIYVRLKAGLEIGEYNDEEIEILTGSIEKSVICKGVVRPAPLADYLVDFEDAAKTGYASATVNLASIDWDMTEALIGNLEADFKNGAKSARFSGKTGSSMTMLEDKIDGLGTLSFLYRQYGNDSQVSWIVEYSTDQGNNWIQIGDEFTATATVQTFNEDMNIAGNIRIRIRTEATGTSNKRLNIDDILLTQYSASTADIPANVPTDIGTGVSITSDTDLNQGAPNDGQNAIIAALPNITNLNISVLTVLSGTGNNVTLTFDISAPGTWYGMLYVGGDWVHGVPFPLIVPDPGTISFSGVNFNAKGDVILLLGEGEDPTLPVELSSFLVSMNAVNQAVLTWISQSETALAGYYILRNVSEDLGSAVQISNLIPATNSSTPYSYSYVDSELNEHGSYYYWLQVNDLDGSIGYHGPVNLVYGATEDPELPPMVPQTELKRIYPNPFNPSTNVAFYLAKAANVSLKIYNHRGQLVRSIHEGYKEAGDYRLNWDGKDDKGAALSTGVYFFRLEAGKKVFTQKAVLMK